VIAWAAPPREALPGQGPPVLLHDSASGQLRKAAAGGVASLYVCGVTPYDAAHLGHAATYVAFDLLHRAWLDAGLSVRYVQNVTDVDDPLLERAAQTGEDWRHLAARQLDVFRDGMAALAVLPPDVFLGVSESIDLIADAVRRLLASGAAYTVANDEPHDQATDQPDIYADIWQDARFGSVAHLSPAAMTDVFAARGGDPQRPGKRHPLDPLLWRSERPGEPAWQVPGLPAGRPGWHIECVALTLAHLGPEFDVQGGGSDLAFPHHEMGASHARMLTGADYARVYAHSGMVGLDGEKMSKSRGNLVFVHRALAGGLDPAALRLALLAHHYRSDWSWSEAQAAVATERLSRWRAATSRPAGPAADRVLAAVRTALAADLDAPAALRAVDDWVATQLGDGGTDPASPELVSRTAYTLLGVQL